MDRIRNGFMSPPIALISGYGFLTFGGLLIFSMGFFNNNDFITWGPPVTIMGKNVTSQVEFYTLLIFFFGHQLINCWISEVVYPYIINEVQNVNRNDIRYKKYALFICIFFAVYSNLDLLIIINGTYSQISFFLSIIIANMISVSYINYRYIKNKKEDILEN